MTSSGRSRRLQDAGHIEIITSSATHGYSALLSQDTSIQAQVKQGIQAYERHFGRKPARLLAAGMLVPSPLPLGASRRCPGRSLRRPILRKGVDEFLAENGIEYFFVEGSPAAWRRDAGRLCRQVRAAQRTVQAVSKRNRQGGVPALHDLPPVSGPLVRAGKEPAAGRVRDGTRRPGSKSGAANTAIRATSGIWSSIRSM